MTNRWRDQMNRKHESTCSFRTLAVSAGLAALLCLPATLATAQTPSLMTTHGNIIAYSEGPIPGHPFPDEYFAYNFLAPFLTDDGTVEFYATMEGGSITPADSRAIFRGTTAADLTTMVRGADPAPGLPGLS